MNIVVKSVTLVAAVSLAACQQESSKTEALTAESVTAPVPTSEALTVSESLPIPQAPVAHLCRGGETIYLTAKLQNVVANPDANTLYKLVPTSKLVSLCLSASNDALIYRYGEANNVELESIATAEAPFKTYHKQIGRVAEDYFSFSRGNYQYVVVEASGMGSGISLRVYQGDKKIVNKFSGNGMNEDFYQSYLSIPENLLKISEPSAVHVE